MTDLFWAYAGNACHLYSLSGGHALCDRQHTRWHMHSARVASRAPEDPCERCSRLLDALEDSKRDVAI